MPKRNRQSQVGPHVPKTQQEREDYKEQVRSTSAFGATGETQLAADAGQSTMPIVRGRAVAAQQGSRRRIQPPAEEAAGGLWTKWWAKLGGGLTLFALIVGLIYRYGRLEQQVDSIFQTTNQLETKHGRHEEKVGDLGERITRLEATLDAVTKNGGSSVAIANELADVRKSLDSKQEQLTNLANRIATIESRLKNPSTQQSLP